MDEELVPFVRACEQDLVAYIWKRTISEQIRGATPDRIPSDAAAMHIAGSSREWVEHLNALANVRYLYAKLKVNQDLFDHVCRLPRLERFHAELTSIENCEAIGDLLAATHISLGSSPALRSIGPLASLRSLLALALSGNFQRIGDLKPVGQMKSLMGLSLIGMESKVQHYRTLEPLSELKQLRYVSLLSVRTTEGGLAPFAHLPKLEYVHLHPSQLKWWPRTDYVRLYENLPNLKGKVIELAATDTAFQRKHGIM